MAHQDNHNVPREGGSLQLKLWADGNKWWSGMPSKTDVFMRVKSIVAYYNTTSSISNQEWHNRCAKEKTQCRAVNNRVEKQLSKVDCKKTPWLKECDFGAPSSSRYPSFTGTKAAPASTCCRSIASQMVVQHGGIFVVMASILAAVV